MAALNFRFRYITVREKYSIADTWCLHSDEVVANFKADKELPIVTQLRYLMVLKCAIYYVANKRAVANAQIKAYIDYTEFLKSQVVDDTKI